MDHEIQKTTKRPGDGKEFKMMTIEDMCGLLVQNNVQEIESDLPQDCPQICESARKLVRKQTISDSMRALIDADL